MANFFIRDMDQIVNFILQGSDQEVEMGSGDDENSDSDWEYEEEEDPKNDKSEDSAVISSTPHAKSPLSDGNRINDDVPASQKADILIPPSFDPLISTAGYTASDSESDVYPQQQGEPSNNSSVVKLLLIPMLIIPKNLVPTILMLVVMYLPEVMETVVFEDG